ncbi:MAG: PQ-loop domain-containing transporter [Dehalococcoidia bacterium]|nr:PQ-loop domain-containing transporter [Dehalococcoidia bacterium]
MSGAETLGWIAGAFTTFSFIPQILRVFKLKSAREISLAFSASLLIGLLIWLGYGIAEGLFPVILWNAVAASLIITLLYAKFKYGR